MCAKIETLTEQRDILKTQIAAATTPATTTRAGKWTIAHRAGARRLNHAKLTKAYPVTQHPHLYQPKINTTAVRKHFAPADLEAYYQAASSPVIVVKPATQDEQ